MKGYRLACEFGFQEYRNGAWEGTYLLTPVQVLHSNKWYPAETYDGYETAAGVPSASVFTAAACAFEVIGTRQTTYQCLRCFTPPSPFQCIGGVDGDGHGCCGGMAESSVFAFVGWRDEMGLRAVLAPSSRRCYGIASTDGAYYYHQPVQDPANPPYVTVGVTVSWYSHPAYHPTHILCDPWY
eukprot:3523067-Rhodomonas_salina.5